MASNFDHLTYHELQSTAKTFGLKAKGTSEELIQRLIDHETTQASSTTLTSVTASQGASSMMTKNIPPSPGPSFVMTTRSATKNAANAANTPKTLGTPRTLKLAAPDLLEDAMVMLPGQEGEKKSKQEVDVENVPPDSAKEEPTPTSTPVPAFFRSDDANAHVASSTLKNMSASPSAVKAAEIAWSSPKTVEKIAASTPKKMGTPTSGEVAWSTPKMNVLIDSSTPKMMGASLSGEKAVEVSFPGLLDEYADESLHCAEDEEVQPSLQRRRGMSLSRLVMSEDKEGKLKAFRNVRKLASRTRKSVTGQVTAEEGGQQESKESARAESKPVSPASADKEKLE
jgi:hypothetical protein